MVIEGKLSSFYKGVVPEQNFDLIISLNNLMSAGDVRDYFSKLEDQITNQKIKQLKFSQFNQFFKSEPTLGIEVSSSNNKLSGGFQYTLEFPN